LRGEQLQNSVEEVRIVVVGHVRVWVGCVWLHPDTNHTGPPLATARRTPLWGLLRSASLRSPHYAAPKGACIARLKPFTEQTLHPPPRRWRRQCFRHGHQGLDKVLLCLLSSLMWCDGCSLLRSSGKDFASFPEPADRLLTKQPANPMQPAHHAFFNQTGCASDLPKQVGPQP